MIETDAILTHDSADHGSCAVAVCSRCAELEREIAKLKEELDWQNMPNRREPFRGGWEVFGNQVEYDLLSGENLYGEANIDTIA
jgi:hypothetical protein